MTLKVRILPFLTTFAQLSARFKNFLGGWLLVLGIKEGLVECAAMCVKSHSDLECLGTFGNWFWDLIVGNRSIMLNFYQQWPFFASKNYPRPQRPKRPMKANKGQQSPKLQISFVIITIQCKIINKCQCGKKNVFLKNLKFSFSLHKLLEITFCWIC